MKDFDETQQQPPPPFWNQPNQYPQQTHNPPPFNQCMQHGPPPPPNPNAHSPSYVNSPNAKFVNRDNNGGKNNDNNLDFMQTQNHIFVFSTVMANQGAEAVINGLHPSIVSYHRNQPGTKLFLEVCLHFSVKIKILMLIIFS